MTFAEDRVARPAVSPDAAGFPVDFVWGAATASYQIEGAVAEDGRLPSIWDTFSAEPGRVVGGDTGAMAADHYHRWRDDVALMDKLRLGAYRFSVAWPRIQPTGSGPVNASGLAFYDRLVDELLAHDLEPWVTLYHWDLPQTLEDRGGWPERETALRFAEFSGHVAAALGDRVRHWITLNEPWCSAFLGYAAGSHAPGRSEPAAAIAAAHHLMLGHGLAVDAVRAVSGQALIGPTVNLYPVHPKPGHPDAADAVRRIDGLQNRWFLDPLLRGGYPDDVRADLERVTDFHFERDGDDAIHNRPIDFLGVNYYSSLVVRPSAFPGSNAVDFVDSGRPRTAMGWGIDKDGLTETLRRVHDDYGPLPLYVTENGAAFDDVVAPDDRIVDVERRDYLAAHLHACQLAIEAGVPLAGYFVWSLLDNFEWAEGYRRRFGIVHVDYGTQERRVKESGAWYSAFIDRHRDGRGRP